MEIDIKQELTNLKESISALDEKLTSIFKDKWIPATCLDNFSSYSGEKKFIKNKAGQIIVFKVEKCRPKACALNGTGILNQIVLEGKDSRGQPRTEVCSRKGFTKLKNIFNSNTKTGIENPNIFEYDIQLFNTEEEAILYAELQEQLEPRKGFF